ncbi:BON domain-containing protein [Winogradskyella pacifica]|uniref:BON domain-containing protein n=1 Tax=Winogradskyella pacifica TaxID=664642 RepID=UPI000E22D2BA
MVENLSVVKGVTDNITLNQFALQPEDIKEKITKAFKRSALVDALGITVDTTRHAVKLAGNVKSVTEKKEAEKVAFKTLAVYAIQNELRVDH